MPDGLLADEALTKDLVGLISILNVNCRVAFQDLLDQMLVTNPDNPVACIISDELFHFTQSVADHFKLPRIILRTNIATTFSIIAALPVLRQKGYYPIQDHPNSDGPLPDLPNLRIKDLPVFSTSNLDTLFQLIDQLIMATRISSGLIINTIDCLEQTTLAEFRHDFQIPVYPIGPLHKHLTETCNSSSLLMDDHGRITWLDRQAPRTIIYVSFGSIAAMDRSELIETAWGLAHSGQPFMWVVRTGLVRGSKWVEFPEGFEDMVGDRGLIVKWVPQQEVLAHPSVGGVWTHCGWNSTLESICEGVPMLCWPCFGDQSVNARLVSHVWRVGIRLEHGLDRDKIEWAIRKLMVGQEGEGMKERIEDLKENVDRCLRKRGSSNQSLNNLIDFILAI
ncbi:UDP-glycosyltransferase 76B1-like [Magnolia sinica]|uniref:UDP-glycosyltransferase 76B1-like n=1 Tax=Magnolia sinica TaxID=86752 RepID=UPI002657DEC1|nr:UDP-glycosyltransferase 76B1-like [Magnolia sinica]